MNELFDFLLTGKIALNPLILKFPAAQSQVSFIKKKTYIANLLPF